MQGIDGMLPTLNRVIIRAQTSLVGAGDKALTLYPVPGSFSILKYLLSPSFLAFPAVPSVC